MTISDDSASHSKSNGHQTEDHSQSKSNRFQSKMIVGVGASAGGLESLERFFDGVDPNLNASYLVVQHLSPNYETMMDSLLKRHTVMEVKIAEHEEKMFPSRVYVLPPKKEMTIKDGLIFLHDQNRGEVPSYPIDRLFHSISEAKDLEMAAVVLSGTGSDGSRGLVSVHNAGGFVMAESETTAKFTGMPNAAFATGLVHEVLAPEEMGRELAKRLKFEQSGVYDDEEDDNAPPVSDQQQIFRILRDHSQINFNHYKPSTVMRRIDRRMKIVGVNSLKEYTEFLRSDTEEVDTLYRDMLIGVTKFFRDPNCWEYLKDQVLDEILENADEDRGARIWVAGCATGEEAYSLAILLYEANQRREFPREIKIFASDVHPGSLQAASMGVFRTDTLSNVSSDRLERYFNRGEGGGYVIDKKIRSMVVFTPHNVLQDPPFTDLDMVTCRNLLIYFDQVGQRKALALFHFGLKKGGFLFLGPSETIGPLQDEFRTIDERLKLYVKLRADRLPFGMNVPIPLRPKTVLDHSGLSIDHNSQRERLRNYDRLIDQVMPKSILVNSQRKVLECFGGAEELLRISSRVFSNDLVDIAPESLQAPMSALFRRCQRDNIRVMLPITGCELGPEKITDVELSVEPVRGEQDDIPLFLVSIQQLNSPLIEQDNTSGQAETPLDVSGSNGEMASRIRSLENDLRHSRENLQATIEELESSNEELQATNEELISSNEELQSTNEELNSVNEELHTVNVEYQSKNTELREVNEDLNNLFGSTDIGTVFLDKSLTIRRFTPRIANIFDLRPQDVGRPLASFSHSLSISNLTELTQNVLRDGTRYEQEVNDAQGVNYVLCLLPYQIDDAIVGVILTLTDISRLVETRELAEKYQSRLQKAIDAVPVFVSFVNRDQKYEYANRAYYTSLKSSREQVIGKHVRDVIGPEAYENNKKYIDAVLRGEPQEFEAELQTSKGDLFLKVSYIPQRSKMGSVTGFYVSGTDVTTVKRAENELARAMETASEANRAKSEFLAKMSHEIRSPMTAILGFVDILAQQLEDPDNLNSIEIIRSNGEHLLDIITDILDLAKIESGMLELHDDHFDLRKLLEQSAETISERAEKNYVEFELQIGSGIQGIISGDRRRLRQVIMNLLTNAVKFSAGKTVRLVCERVMDNFEISVIDTGCGIPPENLEHLFEPFCQADNSDVRKHEGTGLGLTITKQLIEQMGGTITVRSRLDFGSKFSVQLPWTPVEISEDVESELKVVPVKKKTVRLDGRTVLVIDDRRDIRFIAEHMLADAGANVVTAADGLSGVKFAREKMAEGDPFDVIVTDIQMPEMDGYEVAQNIRTDGYTGPILALSASAMASDRAKSLASGCDEHLSKPINRNHFLQLIARLLGGD